MKKFKPIEDNNLRSGSTSFRTSRIEDDNDMNREIEQSSFDYRLKLPKLEARTKDNSND